MQTFPIQSQNQIANARPLEAFTVAHTAITAVRQVPRAGNITVRLNCIAKSQRQSASVKEG